MSEMVRRALSGLQATFRHRPGVASQKTFQKESLVELVRRGHPEGSKQVKRVDLIGEKGPGRPKVVPFDGQ